MSSEQEHRRWVAYQEHLLWMKGWTDGAGKRSMQQESSVLYVEGYVAGQKTWREVSETMAQRMGVKHNKIILCTNPPETT